VPQGTYLVYNGTLAIYRLLLPADQADFAHDM